MLALVRFRLGSFAVPLHFFFLTHEAMHHFSSLGLSISFSGPSAPLEPSLPLQHCASSSSTGEKVLHYGTSHTVIPAKQSHPGLPLCSRQRPPCMTDSLASDMTWRWPPPPTPTQTLVWLFHVNKLKVTLGTLVSQILPEVATLSTSGFHLHGVYVKPEVDMAPGRGGWGVLAVSLLCPHSLGELGNRHCSA